MFKSISFVTTWCLRVFHFNRWLNFSLWMNKLSFQIYSSIASLRVVSCHPDCPTTYMGICNYLLWGDRSIVEPAASDWTLSCSHEYIPKAFFWKATSWPFLETFLCIKEHFSSGSFGIYMNWTLDETIK